MGTLTPLPPPSQSPQLEKKASTLRVRIITSQNLQALFFLHSIVRLKFQLTQLQVQGFTENFEDSCNDAISWISSGNYLPSYTEGWATYIEYPLMARDTDAYVYTADKQILLQKYGMLKYQVSQRATCISEYNVLNYFAFFTSDIMLQAEFTQTRFQINTVTSFRNRIKKYTVTKRLHKNDLSVSSAVTSWLRHVLLPEIWGRLYP